MQADRLLWEKLIGRYNQVFGEAFNQILNDENAFTGVQIDNNEEALRNAVCNNIQNWHDQPLDDEPGSPTANDVLDQITSLDDAVDLARFAVVACDDEIPDIIKIKLSSFGQEMVDRLLDDVLETDFSRMAETTDDDRVSERLLCAGFIKLLGDWQCAACLCPILDRFADAADPDDLLADAVRYYLTTIGNPALPFLIEKLNNALLDRGDLDPAGEYMLIALTDIGKENRSDEIFSCLRSSFRKMKQKAIGAICIGDYGDGRGIPVLKGWLDRHPDYRDNQTIAEILSSIKRLGGEIADLQHRLRLDRR